MKKVVIVNAGERGWLSAEAGSYTGLCLTLQEMFNRVLKSPKAGKSEQPEFGDVDIVEDPAIADSMMTGDILVFVTLGMRAKAKEIKNRNPRLTVVVLTGSLPQDEVVLLHKHMISQELISSLALI